MVLWMLSNDILIRYFNETMLTQEQVISAIREYFGTQENVAAVYLFGSYADGTFRARSDVDVAVLYADDKNRSERFERRLKLMGDLEQVLKNKTDVIDLIDAPPVLVHQIMLSHILVLDNDRDRRIELEVAKRREYFDLLPYVKRHRQAALEQLVERGNGKW